MLQELQDRFITPLSDLLNPPGAPSCEDAEHIEPNMISQYQCQVHRDNIGGDQNKQLPEFVANGNSKLGVTAENLKERMSCCNGEKVVQILKAKTDEIGSGNTFLPYCCKTKAAECPKGNGTQFGYNNTHKEFNGVCYAEGSMVNDVITPYDAERTVTPLPKHDNTSEMIWTLITVTIVCLLLYFNVRSYWARQKQNRVAKQLIRGLENIEKVV